MRMRMRMILVMAILVAAGGLAWGAATVVDGNEGTGGKAARYLKGKTIFSREFPKAELTVRKELRFIGTQRVNLYGNAEAEQFLFARVGRNNTIERFYLMQFEHFLPTNKFTYKYDEMRKAQIGDLAFTYDVRSWPDFATVLAEDPGSDGAATAQLAAKQHLTFARKTVMVRMFHLPSEDRRTELMILYGEALPEESDVPVRKGGVELDVEAPDAAKMFLGRAREGLVIQAR